jgi:hypothetical protein
MYNIIAIQTSKFKKIDKNINYKYLNVSTIIYLNILIKGVRNYMDQIDINILEVMKVNGRATASEISKLYIVIFESAAFYRRYYQ